jgi:multiple sugar transport system ATP-binding protein
MSSVQLLGLRKAYADRVVIDHIDLEVRNGEFMVFVGPSGCGKTTTLRMIAGLESITAGELRIDGVRANESRPAQRGAAMVFQSYALYPHMTIAENMGFSLRMAGVSRKHRRDAVERVARTLRIDHQLERYPRQLSGGERQRVAIGRAIVRQPKVFLFDEPLSNLDAELRVSMRVELSRLHRELGTTMIYVTHDQVEAMTLGERIAVFRDGRIEQIGTPMDMYRQPRTEFVAGFLGTPRMNMLDRPRSGASPAHVALWHALGGDALPRAARLGVRAEHLRVDACAAPDCAGGLVEFVEHLGGASMLHVRVDGVDGAWIAQVHGSDPGAAARGQRVGLCAWPGCVHAFDDEGSNLAA